MIAIDLGSNTIRCVEYDGCAWGCSYEKIVKTAEALPQTGIIGEAALERIVDAVAEARHVMDFESQPVVAFTTAAMRLARNSRNILKALRDRTGIVFEIIDAKREADLTLLAVRRRLQTLGIEPVSFVMADIGGGSTELISVSNDEIRSISINQGIVTLYERAHADDDLEKRITAFEATVKESIFAPHNAVLVLTAGTPTTISAYLQGMDYQTYDPVRINGFRLGLADCFRVYRELSEMDESLRIRYVGVGRERLIGAGVLMVTAIYKALGFSEAIIIDDSLREGIALDYYER